MELRCASQMGLSAAAPATITRLRRPCVDRAPPQFAPGDLCVVDCVAPPEPLTAGSQCTSVERLIAGASRELQWLGSVVPSCGQPLPPPRSQPVLRRVRRVGLVVLPRPPPTLGAWPRQVVPSKQPLDPPTRSHVPQPPLSPPAVLRWWPRSRPPERSIPRLGAVPVAPSLPWLLPKGRPSPQWRSEWRWPQSEPRGATSPSHGSC
mmetsp:Transcript_42837/g.93045  ORF Transcript_42837/g.93045 Transcript_42837/m.93045 type:complete len:206 (+) Transcript_42837:797-1414(+)